MKKALLILTALCLLLPTTAMADRIVLVADQWCPYNCEPDEEEPGYMVEITRTIFQPLGHQVVYRNVEWVKAIEQTREGEYTGIIAAYKEDAPDFVFPENELGISAQYFFVRKGDPWRWAGFPSLQGKKVGIIEAYSYGEKMDAHIAEHPERFVVAGGDDPLGDLLERLMNGSVDSILEDPNVFMLKAMRFYLTDKVERAGQFGEAENAYIAFSPKLPESEEYARILSEGLDDLRESGELDAILADYGLKDWK
ncbi:MAG: substrate-binding periplasmic protein [Desulfatibacillaceae bacterium]